MGNCQINVGDKAQPSGVLRAESITLHSTGFNDACTESKNNGSFFAGLFFPIKALEEGSEFLK